MPDLNLLEKELDSISNELHIRHIFIGQYNWDKFKKFLSKAVTRWTQMYEFYVVLRVFYD